MQFQADIADVVAERAADLESTGRGAAMLAAMGAGVSGDFETAAKMIPITSRFAPAIARKDRDAHLARWNDALARARSSR
jgi:glycerol kinase